MSCDPGSPPAPSNVQGLVMRGYTHPYSTHMLFRFPGRGEAAAFVKALLPYLQSAADWGNCKPRMMLNIGLTFNGLKTATSMSTSDLGAFPNTFQNGPDSSGSQDSLFDLGDSAPANWWAKNFPQSDLHCVVHTYAMDEDAMKKIVETVANAAKTAGVTELFGTAGGTRFEQSQLPDDQIQFGYRDGISEPTLNWPVAGQPFDAGTLDNFVIGYPACTPFQPGPTGDTVAGHFAKDGCYNAFRVIAQDVPGFEKFLDDNAPAIVKKLGMSTADAREWLAAKVIGRWRNGSPLELSPNAPDDKTRNAEDFGYAQDSKGLRCPIAAHTRVSNPRDEPVDDNDQPVPRIARRGMPYGPAGTAPGPDRGLIGLFLCGALDAQFELIYGWMNTNNFSTLFDPNRDTQDATLGNRLVPNADLSFTMPTAKGAITIATMPQFLTTRGTAYCLLPSIASLQAIAAQSV